MLKEALGETLGTFILVFIGCGAVGAAVILGLLTSLLQVAIVFGAGVSLAIYLSQSICNSHLNPAVSVAFAIDKELPWKRLPSHILGQMIGAVIAGILLYMLFGSSIAALEQDSGIVRGTLQSQKTAMMFGEFFPNPDFAETHSIGELGAFALEALGTFILMGVIFILIALYKYLGNLIPLFIGLTVTILILFIAPYTQAGFNPARDLGPRIVAYFAGWGTAAFPIPVRAAVTVYVIGPIVGASLAAVVKRLVLRSL